MPAATPKMNAKRVIDELNLSEQEWNHSLGDTVGNTLRQRVDYCVNKAATRTQKRVGAVYYASADAQTSSDITEAEHSLACGLMLRQRLIALSSRPEEAPPPEYINLDVLQGEIERYERDWAEGIEDYMVDDAATPGTGFAFGGVGVDETEEDDYEESDFGSIP